MTVADKVRVAAQIFEVPSRVILGDNRDPKAILARFALSWAWRARGPSAIARALNRDRSTIYNALRRAEHLRATDPDFAARCAELERKIA